LPGRHSRAGQGVSILKEYEEFKEFNEFKERSQELESRSQEDLGRRALGRNAPDPRFYWLLAPLLELVELLVLLRRLS
jgi:hypothetical protein